MKHKVTKRIVSAALVAAMLMGIPSSMNVSAVSATSDTSDTDVQIKTETESGGDSIDMDGWDIQVGDTKRPADTPSPDIDADIPVKDGSNDSNKTVSDKPADTVSDKDSDIIVSDLTDLLTASVTSTDKGGVLGTGDVATLHVTAENKSKNPAIFKMYFSNVDKLEKDADMGDYLNQPALSCKVQGLSEKCTLDVNVTGVDKKKTKSAVEFLKEVKDDAILSRYARLTLPAGSSVDFDFDIVSSKECTVTVIPVMAQETAVYGEANSVSWEEKTSLLDNVIGFFTGDTPEKEIDVKVDDDIQIDDVQGISADVSESLNEADFASMRLMVLSDDPSVFVGKDNVIGQYGDLYLMQFDSPEAAMQAYDYYKDIVTAVEPDISVEVASNVDAGDTDKEDAGSDTVNDDELDVSTTEEQTSVNDSTVDETQDANPENNPINALNAVDASTDVKKERGVIALIDTGVSEHANVIDRISVIDDDASGDDNSHGDAMVNDIVSQDPEAKILSIKAMNDNGYGTVSALVAAMEYAIEQKVSIINLSLYARTTLSTSVLKSEIEKATDAGIIVVGAAGNDGTDVKDYVPGSVESAYIIGAAGKSGYRQVLSNYGETVDYNVVASSTSEAAALFTGFVSANGLDGVDKVLNQGLVFETGYGDGEDITIQDEDFSEYEVDESKSFLIRYTFADASKLKDNDTLADIFHENRFDVLYSTLVVSPDVYIASDGTYKVKLNSPILNGYATMGYLDGLFARGNNGGNVVTEGVSLDMQTGIATIDEKAFEGASEGDFVDLQAQVLIPVNDCGKRVIQNMTVENHDGTEYTMKLPVYGLQIESIPLAIEGVESDLTEKDFDVYINNRKTPVSEIVWNNDTHEILVSGIYAATIHSVKVIVKKDTDAMIRVALPASQQGYSGGYVSTNLDDMHFFLPEGTDVSGLGVGSNCIATSGAGGDGWEWDAPNPGPGGYIGKPALRCVNFDGEFDYGTMGYIGIPFNLFGLNFKFCDANGTPMGSWTNVNHEGAGVGGTWNLGIPVYCHHLGDSAQVTSSVVPVYYRIVDKWTIGDYTCFAMVIFTENAWNDYPQSQGGVIRFAVPKDDVPEDKVIKLKVEKHWDEDGDTSVRPSRVSVHLYESKKRRGTNAWVGNKGDWSDWNEIKSVNLTGSSWSHTWTGIPRVKVHDMSGDTVNDTVYKYKIVEDAVSGYKTTYKQFALTGAKDGDTVTAKITNELDPLRINLKAKKVWSDSDNALKVRPSSISLTLMVSHKFPGDSDWSSWSEVSSKTLKKVNKWTVTWKDQIRKKGKKLWKYKIVEKTVPDNYKVSYDPDKGIYDFTDVEDGDTLLVTVTNKISPSYLKLHKDSELPDVTDDNDNYSLAGAVYEVYTDSACKSEDKANYLGGPLKTNSNGDTPAIRLVPGTYWVKETDAPDGFYKDTEAHKVTVKAEHTSDEPMKLKVTDKPKQGKIKITKTSKIPSKTDDNTNYSLENAKYGVYTDEACSSSERVTTITTDAEGKGTSSNLPLGDYWVKEIADKPSKGFDADPTVYPVTITEKSDGTVTTPAVESKEPPVFGKIEVTKKSENPDMTDGNDCYSYEGAKYRVYTDEACTERYGTKDITIGANGKGELGDIPFGTYWVKELSNGTVDGKGKSYAKGYFVDTKTHKVVVKNVAGDSTNTTKLASEEPAMNDPMGIQITKESLSPTTSTTPSLAGAEFTVRYYDTLENLSTLETKIKNGSVAATRTWVIKTKKLGSSYIAMLGDGWKVSGDDFYKDVHGGVIVPLGTITVQETKPAPGYMLSNRGEFKDAFGNVVMKSNEVYYSQIADETSGVFLNGGNEYTMTNDPEDINLKVVKYGPDKAPLAGVKYKITHEDGSAVQDKDGNTVGEKTTGADGVIEFKKLYPDVYLITETKTTDNTSLLAKPIRIEAPMRMSKEEAQKQNLDTSDKTKVIWSDEENCYLIMKFTTEVTNTSTFKIPLTGSTVGVWTFLPLGIGMVLLTGVAFVLFRKKKRNMRVE